jgi:hypothetical protein
LTTLVGHPDQGEIRFGLLRSGLPGPLGEAYATLAAPRGLCPPLNGSFAVSTGASVVQVSMPDPRQQDQPATLELTGLQAGPAQAGAPCRVRFTVGVNVKAALQSTFRLDATVAFLDAEGVQVDLERLSSVPGEPFETKGTFLRPGTGWVEVWVVSSEGLSCHGKQQVEVGPRSMEAAIKE